MSNPLLQEFNTPFESVPFDKIKNEHFLEALKVAIDLHKQEVEEFKNSEDGSFEAFEKFIQGGDRLGYVRSTFFNLHSANTNDEMTKIAEEFSPLLTAHGNDISLDEKVFEKIKILHDQKDKLSLNTEQMTLLENNYKSFVRNGALLSQEDKQKLRDLDEKMSKISLNFSNNLLKETQNFELVIEDEQDLAGLPEGLKEAAKMTAKERGHDNSWVITLDFPSFYPFLMYAENRSLREVVAKASGSKCDHDNDFNNEKNCKEMARLRFERARLLGYATYADFVLEERMAQSKDKVYSLLNELKEKALPSAKEHVELLKKYAKEKDGIEDFQSWDYLYYFEKMKKEKFSIDDEALKPYFKLENVVDGVFKVANKLYGLNFTVRNDIPKYHEDVITYEITDEAGDHVALFYGDYFPRKGKRGGAWMTAYREQYVRDGKDIRPLISNVCNFTKPTESKPSLLTFNEVLTLFHEFGHGLHGILSKCQYKDTSGTNVYWDFVELPSQIFENWAYEKECLDLFAKHYETDEVIPMELVQKIKDSSNFGEGYATIRQLSFALVDLGWHTVDPSEIKDIEEFERNILDELTFFPRVEGTTSSTAFGHIFAGGYSAGYYSYKWAEVLDADAFEAFKENGVFNRDVADRFRENILEKGGSDHPMNLYKKFRGSEPSVDALLKRGGLN